jgi:ASCH domain
MPMSTVKTSKRVAKPTFPVTASGLPRRALSIRQPWAELILRGKKKIEVRSFATKIRGPMCLYASFTRGADDSKCQRSVGCSWEELTRGVLVGIIEIVDCRELRATDNRAAGFQIYNPDGLFAWLVKPLKRFAKPIAPKAHAQPSFFFPFG